ncbi:MAG TPA: cysteine-rich CWC family protein [Rhodocyclaceae bacterium]|nr:cysteine-rich CWC family protein [Rhodocyclaceae bacterium]
MDARPENTCPRCGKAFVCGMAAGLEKCWCAELPPLPFTDAAVAGCFCPDCLRELTAAAADGHSAGD